MKNKEIDIDLDKYIITLRIASNFSLPPYKIKVPDRQPRPTWFLGRNFFEDIAYSLSGMLKVKREAEYIRVPFPQASIIFMPIVRLEKIPVKKELIATTFTEDITMPTSISQMKVKVVEHLPYMYTLPQEKMFNCIFADGLKLCIKKSLLFDHLAWGMKDGFLFNQYTALNRIKEIDVDSFYELR